MEKKERNKFRGVRNSTLRTIRTAAGERSGQQAEKPEGTGLTAPATPLLVNESPEALLKSSISISGTTTPDDDFRIPIASSSLKRIPPPPAPQPLTVAQKLHHGLAVAFSKEGKPVPTPRQSEAALKALGEEWTLFLEWLPQSRQFQRTESPGGLPSLIEFFRSTREAIREAAAPTAPAPCPKCAPLKGRILKTHVHRGGIFDGKEYTAITECDEPGCELGKFLRAGRERFESESRKPGNTFEAFTEPEE